ncbi:ObirGr22 [Ooceraea biroi]|uniref:Gustatory receptor n=1 Tax=Ooceraea biroi TaxID=2015173 RepID=A0A3L8DF22_OOCBI|nr:ObirGr22 [Ooceraea biroi]
MMKTIQAALSPLLTIGSICGLAIFEYPPGRARPYFSCLYFSITWSLYVFLCYYLFYNNYAVVISWPIKVVMLTTIVSVCDSLFHFKDLSTCLRKLSVVDDTLQVLGTPKEYRLLYKWTIGVIIGWIILACFLNTIDSIVSYYYTREHSDIVRICVPFFTNHLFHVDTYSGLIWGTILGYTGSRFQRINEHIYTLLSEDTKCIKRWDKLIPINYQSRAEAKDCKRYIWIIMHIHLHLSHISHQLNKVFSMQMTLQMASYFAFFVDLLCVIYTSYIDKSKNIGSILDGLFSYIWLVVCIVKVFGLTHICQTVSDKAQETITILYKLSNDNPDEDLREQVLQFILQIKQREIKFSGLGLFYFDYGFIRHFCKSIVTILIIIIQMHVSYDDISQPVNDEDYIVI